jgi:hypothetical protein
MSKTLFMETTQVSAEKTSTEMLSLLVQAGAREVLQQFDGNGKLTGLKFALDVRRENVNRTMIFQLPVRVEPVFKLINGRRKYEWDKREQAKKDREQAERVAWRQLFRWCQAQLALIQTGMVEAAEVFFPYCQTEDGRTFWEYALSGGQLLLPPAEKTNVKRFPEVNG